MRLAKLSTISPGYRWRCWILASRCGGDSVNIVGKHTDFQQTVTSMQVEHEDVEEGQPGQEVAVKVDDRVRPGDEVFRVEG